LESIDVEHLDILKSVHNSIVGHFGITYTIKMLEDFKLINNWPSYRSDVKDFIKSCAICQKIKPAPIVLAPITPVDLIALAATDQDEFIVEAILAHRGNAKKKSSLEFLIKWQGYEDEFNTWEPYSLVKDLQLLDQYAQQHPNLRI
jgi:hypothetical protein